ncbi:MAG: molybdate ABC transporter substrate-binding protein [Steroidobacteraceae bacterium]
MHRRSVLVLLLLLSAIEANAAERIVTVFAAASLTDVLEAVGKAYTAANQVPVRFSFAASSALARQIESGAPADVFVSADQDWMDYLAGNNLLRADTRRDIVSNSLVLVAPATSRLSLRIESGFKLAAALGRNGRIATGDPASVPVGKYARAALTKLGVWDAVQARIIPADNVRTALNFVALGEAPLGIVYATDARGQSKVRVVDTFPAATHAPISYPAAVIGNAGADAIGFVRFLSSDTAQLIFERAGFGRP